MRYLVLTILLTGCATPACYQRDVNLVWGHYFDGCMEAIHNDEKCESNAKRYIYQRFP